MWNDFKLGLVSNDTSVLNDDADKHYAMVRFPLKSRAMIDIVTSIQYSN
jgi:hypothetical protein